MTGPDRMGIESRSADAAERNRASALRRGALELLEGSGLRELLAGALGEVVVVGSVDLDLMVWPDIDLYTALPATDGPRLLQLLPAIEQGLRRRDCALVRVSYNDEYRRPGNPYGEGLYLGLHVLDARVPTGAWKIDLWGWAPATYRAKLEEHRALRAALQTADRDLVLRIKSAVHRRPEYRKTITSMDVYDFVLSGSGTSVEAFDAFLSARAGGGAGDAATGTIRAAARADYPAVLEINRAGTPGVSRLDEATLHELARVPDQVFVCEQGGAIAGYLIVVASDGESAGEEFDWFAARLPRFLYIDQVAVATGQRRSGVASALYRHAESLARARRLDVLACEVNLEPPNPQSLAFHARQGFARIGELRTRSGRLVALLKRPVAESP